jgi:hypothetical protein
MLVLHMQYLVIRLVVSYGPADVVHQGVNKVLTAAWLFSLLDQSSLCF